MFFVILATIPAVIVGALLRKFLGEIFAAPAIAAVFLIVNGFMLYFGDRIGEEAAGTLEQLNWKGALAIGVAQCFALIPGISRSGSTIVAGVVAGLKHAEAARFSFLMGAPIILAANVHEAPKLLKEGATLGGMAILSGVVAGIVAYLSLTVLMRYLRQHEFEAMSPFAYYCWAAGVISLAVIALA